jgi:hypothetical protein
MFKVTFHLGLEGLVSTPANRSWFLAARRPLDNMASSVSPLLMMLGTDISYEQVFNWRGWQDFRP